MEYNYDGPRESAGLTYYFPVPPQRLFEAWTTPEMANLWLFTNKVSKSVFEMDVQVGGAFSVVRTSNGKTTEAMGHYLELEPPHRLQFTFCMPQLAADLEVISIDIVPDGQGCSLTLTQEGMRPGNKTACVTGWTKMFMALTKIFKANPV